MKTQRGTKLVAAGAMVVLALALLFVSMHDLQSAASTPPRLKEFSVSSCAAAPDVTGSAPEWGKGKPQDLGPASQPATSASSSSSPLVADAKLRLLVLRSDAIVAVKAESPGAVRFHTDDGRAPRGTERDVAVAAQKYVPLVFRTQRVLYSKDKAACGYVTFRWLPVAGQESMVTKDLTALDLYHGISGIAFLDTVDREAVNSSPFPVIPFIIKSAQLLTERTGVPFAPATIHQFYRQTKRGEYVNLETGQSLSQTSLERAVQKYGTAKSQ